MEGKKRRNEVWERFWGIAGGAGSTREVEQSSVQFRERPLNRVVAYTVLYRWYRGEGQGVGE